MKVLTVNIQNVKPYEKNPRRNEHSVDIVAQSLKEYGFQQPIVVDKDYYIIVGHTRYLAAKKLGYKEVPIVIADTLTESQVRSYRIADNKTNEYSQWDQSLLTEELDQLMRQYDINSVSALTGMGVMDIGDLVFDELYFRNKMSLPLPDSNVISKYRLAIVIDRFFAQKHGGITTYIAGWLEWAWRNKCYVDIIADFDRSELNHGHFEKYRNISHWIFSEHANKQTNTNSQGEEIDLDNDLFLKSRNNIALDASSRMRASLLMALRLHCYDAIIVNDHDTLLTLLSVGMHCIFDKIFYITHSGIDLGWYHNISRYSFRDANWRTRILYALLKSGDIKVLCQTHKARNSFIEAANYEADRVFYCPVHIGQSELQQFPVIPNRKGILWIGRWEAIKDPELYIKLCKETGLPALLIVGSATSARKFKKRFLEENIEHEIHVGLTGEHKINVMRTAAVAIQTSLDETFCYAAFEAAHCCPLILPKERSWTEVHKDWATIVPIDEMANTIKKLYGQPVDKTVEKNLINFVKEGDSVTAKLIEKPVVESVASNALTKWLEKVGEGTLEEFFKTRPRVVFDEVYYALKLQYHPDYDVEHGKEYTLFRYKKFNAAKASSVLSYKNRRD